MSKSADPESRRGVGDAAAGLGLHFLHVSEGPFSHDASHMRIMIIENIVKNGPFQFAPDEQVIYFPFNVFKVI